VQNFQLVIKMHPANKGSSINDFTRRGGRGVHDIVTMGDVRGRGERLRDVTHVTSAAKPVHGVVDDSASI